MLCHIDMYALADKYSIEKLKVLARALFGTLVEDNFQHDAFAKVVKRACTATPSTDKGLRSVVTENLFIWRSVLKKRSYREVLEDESSFALDFIDQSVQDADESDELRLKSLKEKELEIEDMERLVSAHASCSSCEGDGTLKLVHDEWKCKVSLRCTECNLSIEKAFPA